MEKDLRELKVRRCAVLCFDYLIVKKKTCSDV